MSEHFARPVEIPRSAERLSGKSVIVVGVGGLGSEVARLLAQAGVGRLVLCDPDVVEEGNLSTGALYTARQAETGTLKVEAAAQALALLSPKTKVDARASDFRYGLGLGELRSADLVLSCLESIGDRIALSSRCMFSGNPRGLLDAGLHPWGGEVRNYVPDGSCYTCGCSPSDRAMPNWHEACRLPAVLGASGPVAALVAAWQAVYAVRLLFGERIPGGVTRIDAPTGMTRPVDLARDPDCPCHETIDERFITETELTGESTAAELLTLVDADERVLSWNPLDRHDALSPFTLGAARPESRLRDLGIPAGEILPVIRVRPLRHVRYLALAEA